MGMIIESPEFQAHAPIPYEYTCEGEDVSPPLVLKGIPQDAVSLVLILEDPDAPMGTFDHWVAWNIPPGQTNLEKGYTPPIEGVNHFHETRYRGPCPPPGKPHHYYFKLFALDISLTLPRGSTKEQVLSSIKEHILAKAELVGTYQRGSHSH